MTEKFILPLLTLLKDDRSVQNSHLTKLITLVNSRAIVDFMSDLHIVLSGVFQRYQSRQLLQFEQFFEFSKDHDIFPQQCSKAAVSRIFYSLAKLRESLNPNGQGDQRNVSDFEFSTMSPGQDGHTAAKGQYIDQNLFTEAVTLCALYSTDAPFLKMLKKYKEDEPCAALEHMSLQRCLGLVQRMNESDGKVSGAGSNMKASIHTNLGLQFKTSLLDKTSLDLLALFKKKTKQYGWFFDEQSAIKKRFTPKKWVPDFDEVFNMEDSLSMQD